METENKSVIVSIQSHSITVAPTLNLTSVGIYSVFTDYIA